MTAVPTSEGWDIRPSEQPAKYPGWLRLTIILGGSAAGWALIFAGVLYLTGGAD